MEKGHFLQEFIAGNVGGLIGMTLVVICTLPSADLSNIYSFIQYPLDTAKMRMQTYSSYAGTVDVMRKMIRADSVFSLYRGLASPAVGFGLTFAVSFSSYGTCCRQIANYKQVDLNQLSGLDLFTSGAITGAVQSPFRAVVDRIKSVMQVRESTPGKSPYSWSGACFVDLIRKDGFRVGLFQGFNSVLLREVPQFAIYYPSYEYLKEALSSSQYLNPFFVQLLSGGIAGTIQWLPPFYCFDVIKSRMQTVPVGFYSSMMDCAVKLWKQEGPYVFIRGLSPALMRAFPLHSIIFASYELTMKYTAPHFQWKS